MSFKLWRMVKKILLNGKVYLSADKLRVTISSYKKLIKPWIE